jgi:hypothetical protein
MQRRPRRGAFPSETLFSEGGQQPVLSSLSFLPTRQRFQVWVYPYMPVCHCPAPTIFIFTHLLTQGTPVCPVYFNLIVNTFVLNLYPQKKRSDSSRPFDPILYEHRAAFFHSRLHEHGLITELEIDTTSTTLIDFSKVILIHFGSSLHQVTFSPVLEAPEGSPESIPFFFLCRKSKLGRCPNNGIVLHKEPISAHFSTVKQLCQDPRFAGPENKIVRDTNQAPIILLRISESYI